MNKISLILLIIYNLWSSPLYSSSECVPGEGILQALKERSLQDQRLFGEAVPRKVNEWPLFHFNNFSIRFPKSPTITASGNTNSYTATDTSALTCVIYGLTHKRDIQDLDGEHLFQKVLEARGSWPNVLVEYSITTLDGYPVLDLTTENTLTRVLQQERVMIVNQDLYMLYSIFYILTPSSHQYFVNSFSYNEGVSAE